MALGMPQAALLWLVVLVVLAALFVLTLRRLSTLIGRTRTLERDQKQAAQLAQRLAVTAEPFIVQLDEIRRRSGDPRGLAEAMPGAQDALRAIADEGRAAKVPKGVGREGAAFLVELERAVRAAELVGHGLDALVADRGGRDLEAQTSLKRGALNLRHASEAATRIAREIGAIRPADLLNRSEAPDAVRSSVPTYLVDGEFDDQR
jgi:hypothetical protein